MYLVGCSEARSGAGATRRRALWPIGLNARAHIESRHQAAAQGLGPHASNAASPVPTAACKALQSVPPSRGNRGIHAALLLALLISSLHAGSSFCVAAFMAIFVKVLRSGAGIHEGSSVSWV